MTQKLNGFTIEIKSADDLGGYPMTGKNDAAIIEIYNEDGTLSEKSWLVISKNGTARLEKM